MPDSFTPIALDAAIRAGCEAVNGPCDVCEHPRVDCRGELCTAIPAALRSLATPTSEAINAASAGISPGGLTGLRGEGKQDFRGVWHGSRTDKTASVRENNPVSGRPPKREVLGGAARNRLSRVREGEGSWRRCRSAI